MRFVVIAAAVGGMVWFGPQASGHALEVRVDVEEPGCAESVEVRLMQDRQTARALRAALPPSGPWRYEMRLPEGRYRLHARLICEDGVPLRAAERPLRMQDDETISVRLRESCPCPAAKVRP